MSIEWFFMRDGIKHGPITSKQLKQLADSGKIQPTDLIWKQGFSDWRPAAVLTVLFDPTANRAVEPDHSQENMSVDTSCKKPGFVKAKRPFCVAVLAASAVLLLGGYFAWVKYAHRSQLAYKRLIPIEDHQGDMTAKQSLKGTTASPPGAASSQRDVESDQHKTGNTASGKLIPQEHPQVQENETGPAIGDVAASHDQSVSPIVNKIHKDFPDGVSMTIIFLDTPLFFTEIGTVSLIFSIPDKPLYTHGISVNSLADVVVRQYNYNQSDNNARTCKLTRDSILNFRYIKDKRLHTFLVGDPVISSKEGQTAFEYADITSSYLLHYLEGDEFPSILVWNPKTGERTEIELMTRDGDSIRELFRVIKEECKTRIITIEDAMDKFADRIKHIDKTAQQGAREAMAKADVDARRAETAAEDAYQTQLKEAREKGDLQTVAKLERAHQLTKRAQKWKAYSSGRR